MGVTLKDCKKIIQRYTKDDSTAVAFQVLPLTISDAPIGFLGEHFRLNVTYKTPQNRVQIATFFLKTVPTSNPDFIQYVRELGVFKKEASLYKHLLDDFQQYHNHPIAAKSYLVNPDSFIVLEDLSKERYTMVDSVDHGNMIQLMKTLARFHSSSIIFEETRSVPGRSYRLIDHFPEELKETTFNPIKGTARNRWAKSTSRAVADTMLMQSEEYRQISEAFMQFVEKDIFNYVYPSSEYRNVINHADLWKNNVLFKHHAGCVIIDYQLVRYTPPALDLMTALHINSTTNYLEKHMKELLDIYYRTFQSSLEKHGIAIDSVFRGNEFEESVAYFEIASLTESAMFGTIIFIGDELGQRITNDEEAFNEFTYTNRSKYIMEEVANNPKFATRYTDILRRLIDCLLKR